MKATGDDLDAAVAANSAAVQAAMAEMREAEVAEVDIRTLNFSVSEPRELRFGDDDAPPPPKHEVSNTLEVTVRQIGTLGAILAAVSSSGANEIHGLSFQVDDEAPHLAEARRLAVRDARGKAALYAEAAGVTLGRLLDFAEGTALSHEKVGIVYEPEAVVEEVPLGSAEVSFTEGVTLIYAIE